MALRNLGAALLLALSAAACSTKDPTLIRVAVGTDLAAGAIDHIEIEVTWPGALGVQRLACGGVLPFSFDVEPVDNRLDVPMRITTRAFAPNGDLLVQSIALASFSENQHLLLEIALNDKCSHQLCDLYENPTESCVDGACRPIQRSSLPIATQPPAAETHQCVSASSFAGTADGGADATTDGGDGGEDADADAGNPLLETFACGPYSTCALSHGQVYCWGADTRNPRTPEDPYPAPPTGSMTPQWINIGATAVSVCAGEAFGCALTDDGRVICWGDNSLGELGLGTSGGGGISMRAVTLPGAAHVLRCGQDNACAILQDGSPWCWGSNHEHQLLMEQPDFTGPTWVGTQPLVDIAPGQGHMCGVTSLGVLLCWGRNNHSQLGLGPGMAANYNEVMSPPGFTKWTSVVSSEEGSCALASDESIWCWGGNVSGRTGVTGIADAGDGIVYAPTRLDGPGPWRDPTSGYAHTCALRFNGELWGWGDDLYDQLGLGLPAYPEVQDAAPILSPMKLGAPWDAHESIVRLRAGRFHTCMRGDRGSLWCAGSNYQGQIGPSVHITTSGFQRVALP